MKEHLYNKHQFTEFIRGLLPKPRANLFPVSQKLFQNIKVEEDVCGSFYKANMMGIHNPDKAGTEKQSYRPVSS